MITKRLKNKCLLLKAFFFFLLISSCNNSNHYQITIVDDLTGEQLAARVSVTDTYDKSIQIDDAGGQVEYLGKIWYYTDGSFSFSATGRKVTLEVQNGPETVPVKISSEDGSLQRVIRLHKWVDMKKLGYMNGDIHIHAPFSNAAQLQMRAEDLDFLNILVGEDSIKNSQFTGKIDPASTPGHSIYVAQEVRDWQMGHLTLLGLNTLVPGYPIVGGSLESYQHPNWLMAFAMDQTHLQGGLVLWAHYTNLPGAESAVAIALGKVDALELMTYDDPTHLPSHWGPWKNSGMSMPEFPIMRGMDLYYQYLNAGFRLPIVAGTDKMADDIPMGSNRYYANTQGDTTYNAWLSAIKTGKGFITNGPILTFNVNSYSSGEVINFHDTQKVHASVTARSVLPFATIEIIVNGWVVGHKTIFPSDNPPLNGVYTITLETDLVLSESSWIAARVADDPDNKQRILPRGLTVFAHTNPVYFLKDGFRVKDKNSILYLQKYVKGTITWLHTKPPFTNSDDRLEALKLAQDAYDVYESLRR